MKFFDRFHHPRAGAILLRVTLALLTLLHGYSKLQHGIDPIQSMLAKSGMPSFLAFGVYVGEVLAPLALLAGVFVVPAALVVAFNMVVAVMLAHTGQLLQLSKTGGWAVELQAFYFVTALVVALTASSAHGTKKKA